MKITETRTKKWQAKRNAIPKEPTTVCRKLKYMFKRTNNYEHYR